MIVKVQRALLSTDGVDRVLIYNHDRSFVYEGGVNEDLKDVLAGRPKAYYEAVMTADGLEIGDEVEAQPW